MTKKLKFTLPRLRGLTCPPDKQRVFFQDTLQPELLVQITQAGTKSYHCRSWNPVKGFSERKLINKLHLIDLTEARRRAREMAVQLSHGKDPNAEIKRLQNETTLSEAFSTFMDNPAGRKKKGPRRETTNRDYRKRYRLHLDKRFGTKKLSSITRPQLDAFHTRLGSDSGIYAANRTLTLLSGIYNDAIHKGWKGENPARGIEAFPESRRKRFLDETELGPFIRGCESERETGNRIMADAVLMALFTGLRRTNVCSASWDHIDLDAGTWCIPGTQMKNGDELTVYLCDYIRGNLEKRYRYRECNKRVFPGRGRTGHIMEPIKGIQRIVQRAGISSQGVNMHCLKHTFLTYVDDSGLPSAVRKRLAAHRGKGDVTDGYTHALESRVREAYEKVAQHMLKFADRTQQFS